MRILPNCGKLEVRESPIEGFGVFATDIIKAGTVLEEVPFVLFPRYTSLAKEIFEVLKANQWVNPKETYMENLRANLSFKEPSKYYFKWHPPVALDDNSMWTVLPLGFGPVYNTSNTANNADWKINRDTFTFRAEKDIQEDEEIRTFYGYFLGEDGATFPCETVFHFGIDMFPNAENALEHRLKLLRFGNLDSFKAQRQNPAAHKIHSLIKQSVDGLMVKKVALLQPNLSPIGGFEFSSYVKLTQLYQKLTEAYHHPAPVIEFSVEYLETSSHQKKQDTIIWKKE